MNREIKFRAWGTDEKEMVGWKSLITGGYGLDELGTNGVYAHIFMQFTGFTDKNGKEIYESDILMFEDGVIDHIVWSKDYQFHTKNNLDNGQCNFDESEAEIIGNIHMNPSLLKE